MSSFLCGVKPVVAVVAAAVAVGRPVGNKRPMQLSGLVEYLGE